MAQPQPVVQRAWILSRTAASSGWAATPVPVLIGKINVAENLVVFLETAIDAFGRARCLMITITSISVWDSTVLPVEAGIICFERFQIAVVNATRRNAPSSTHLATTHAKTKWTAWDFVHLLSILDGSPSSAMRGGMPHCVPVVTCHRDDIVFLWKSISRSFELITTTFRGKKDFNRWLLKKTFLRYSMVLAVCGSYHSREPRNCTQRNIALMTFIVQWDIALRWVLIQESCHLRVTFYSIPW